MTTTQPSIGRVLLVAVHPDDNDGVEEAPALVTRVHHDGTVNLRVFPDVPVPGKERLQRVPVYPDRKSLDKALSGHLEDLPGAKNKATDQDWTPHDVTRWVTGAYWPPRAELVDDGQGDEDLDDDELVDEEQGDDAKKPAKKTAPVKKTTPAQK